MVGARGHPDADADEHSAGALCVRDSPLDLHGAFEALTTDGSAAISPSPVYLTLDLETAAKIFGAALSTTCRSPR